MLRTLGKTGLSSGVYSAVNFSPLDPAPRQELVWKSCLTQRAGETRVLPPKTIHVSVSQRFPVKDIFREVPSTATGDGLITHTGKSSAVPERTQASEHGCFPSSTQTRALPHPRILLLAWRLQRVRRTRWPSPCPPRESPSLAQPRWAPRGFPPQEGMGQRRQQQDLSSRQAAAAVSMATQPITRAHPTIDICFACSKSWEAIITAPGS